MSSSLTMASLAFPLRMCTPIVPRRFLAGHNFLWTGRPAAGSLCDMTTRFTPLLVLLLATVSLAQDATPLRVMSFNVRYGTARDGDDHWDKRKDFLVETIKAFDPDIMGTQET